MYILVNLLIIKPYVKQSRAYNCPREEQFLKILREKEKMLVTSIFSFSLNVFYTPTIKRNSRRFRPKMH